MPADSLRCEKLRVPGPGPCAVLHVLSSMADFRAEAVAHLWAAPYLYLSLHVYLFGGQLRGSERAYPPSLTSLDTCGFGYPLGTLTSMHGAPSHKKRCGAGADKGAGTDGVREGLGVRGSYLPAELIVVLAFCLSPIFSTWASAI